MREHVYYSLRITLTSPMSIGNGQSENTQNDVLLDGTGKPMIPGSTIAGKMRSLLKSKDLQKKMFGTIEGMTQESAVYVYDAKVKSMFTISRRDNVRLDEWKTAATKAKFDYEVIEPGAVFEGLLEIRAGVQKDIQQQLELILEQLSDGTQSFGGKENRGLGTFLLKVWKKSFDLTKDLENWLKFNPFDDWKNINTALILEKVSSSVPVSNPITQASEISIQTDTMDIGDVDKSSKHVYYSLQFTLTSPMSIGNEQSENTRNDILLDREGNPMIPGSTIAEKIWSLLKSKDLQIDMFGTIEEKKQESAVCVSDAKVKSAFTKKRRDSVNLDERKTEASKAKLDYEVVESGALFEGLLEIRPGVPEKIQQQLEQILKQLSEGIQSFDGKENQKSGTFSLNVWKKTFDLSNSQDLQNWNEFKTFDDWKNIDTALALDKMPGGVLVSIPIAQAGGISIRTYTTDIEDVDYRTLCYEGRTNTAVISGTSWAGAFRHQVAVLAHETAEKGETVRELFGYVDEEKNETRPSSVVFFETVLSGGEQKKITRNAIDRFSAKTKNGALYGEQTYFGGSGIFKFKIKSVLSGKAVRVFGAALADLINGYLAVGGLTAVGRGLFTAPEIRIGETTICTGEDGWENKMIRLLENTIQTLDQNKAQEGANPS